MKIKILCTLGPASFHPDVIQALDQRGVDIFRINLSHMALESVESAIGLVRRVSSTPICLDTEGPQIRCGFVEDALEFTSGAEIRLTAEATQGSTKELTLWPRGIFDALEIGSYLTIDFDGASVRVTEVGDGWANAIVERSGGVRSNKAVTVHPMPVLPSLSEKDIAAIEIGARNGITHYALSFATSAEEVSKIRALAPAGAQIMAKIESREGVRNMDGIMHAADIVLIDRGDLSRDIPFEHVPYYQKAIVRKANRWNRPVFVATNLLESMVVRRAPTIAESNDIANTLLDGVHGLVLAAETAVGNDPAGSVDVVLRAIQAFELFSESHLLVDGLLPIDTRT